MASMKEESDNQWCHGSRVTETLGLVETLELMKSSSFGDIELILIESTSICTELENPEKNCQQEEICEESPEETYGEKKRKNLHLSTVMII